VQCSLASRGLESMTTNAYDPNQLASRFADASMPGSREGIWLSGYLTIRPRSVSRVSRADGAGVWVHVAGDCAWHLPSVCEPRNTTRARIR